MSKRRWSTATEAHAARHIVEDALDATGWRWSLRLSRWLDFLVVRGEERES